MLDELTLPVPEKVDGKVLVLTVYDDFVGFYFLGEEDNRVRLPKASTPNENMVLVVVEFTA